MSYIIFCVGIIVTVIFISKRKATVPLHIALLKGISGMFFVLTACAGFLQNELITKTFGCSMILAAFMGLLGDVSLDLKYVYPEDDNVFLRCGFTCFLLGHFGYIFGLASAYKLTYINVIFMVALMIISIISVPLNEKFFNIDFGKFKGMTIAYGMGLTAFVGLAISLALSEPYIDTILLGVGALLFMVSDMFLTTIYFSKKDEERTKRRTIILNLSTYFLGQFLIALSLSFYNGTVSNYIF
ncbi:MAG: lysoplasmalogenase family protein [Acutalibacteraceae bacterium]